MSNRFVLAAQGSGSSSSGRRAGILIVALLALTLAGGASVGAGPAYAGAASAQRKAITGASTVTRGSGSGLLRVAPGTDATTAAFQDRMEAAVQHLLDTVLGPGRSTVATTVELDLDQVTTSSSTYRRSPFAGALSERISGRSYVGDNGGTRYDSSNVARVNALDELHETRRNAPGGIIKLSVAVLVDEAAATKVDLAQVRELVAVAAGIEAGRGDRVTVAAMPMRIATAIPADTAVAQPDTESAVRLRTSLIAVVLILLTCATLLAIRRRRRGAAVASAAADHRELLRAQLHIQRTAVPAAAVPIATAPDEGRLRQRAIGSVDPAQTAQHLRDWIGSGR